MGVAATLPEVSEWTLLGPVVGEYSSLSSFTFNVINSSCALQVAKM